MPRGHGPPKAARLRRWTDKPVLGPAC